jgi:F0F1-type ATP synthase beta subunit
MVDFEFAKMKQVISAVSKQLGKPELEIQEYVSWSDTEEKHLLSAAILASKKSKVATLQITYVPADNLIPPRKLVTQ